MIDFLLKSTLSMGLLYTVYILMLEKEKMHQFNRFFLLFCLIFSMAIPFITFEIYVESAAIVNQNAIQVMPFSSVIIEEKTDYIPLILWSIYVLITTILISRFIIHLIKIKKKINSNRSEKIEDATLVLLNEKVLPHTFLNYIFINKEDYESRTIEDELFTHELTHFRQKHTFDILFIEILKTVLWFNPLLILFKKAIQLNHEFLADEKVVTSYNNVPFYQNLLLEKASWDNTFYLASNLNFLVTKKRLIMMTKTTTSKILFLRKLALAPILSAMIYLFCIETVAQQRNQTSKNKSETNKVYDDKKLDEYFAGVRFKLYKKDANTTKADLRKNLIFDKTYEELTQEDKAKFKLWLQVPKAIVKKSPTKTELEDYKNSKKYAIWVDDKNVPNSELNKYNPNDIAYFSGSTVLKNARTKKHPQPFQFWFYTHPYFDKNQKGKQPTKYGGDKIEIFENFEKEIVEKKTLKEIAKHSVELKADGNISNQDDKKKYKEYLEKNGAQKEGDKENLINQQSDGTIYNKVDKRPDFPGGIQAFYSFVGKNFNVPNVKNLNGRIFIQFIVEADGTLTNIENLRDIGHGTGDEAIRVLKLSPKWIPGEQDGKKVRVLYSLPISIKS